MIGAGIILFGREADPLFSFVIPGEGAAWPEDPEPSGAEGEIHPPHDG